MSINQPIISLSTDFGLLDSYVAQMKGVILSLCSEALIVDVSHQLPAYAVQSAGRVIAEAAFSFPEESIHIGVVDPGVGSSRRRIILRTLLNPPGAKAKEMLFIGPDNGLFSFVVENSSESFCWEITELEKLPAVERFSTFDGRDVFAPTGALIAKGAAPADFGPEIMVENLVHFATPILEILPDGSISGEIVYFDSFGNAASNIPATMLGSESSRIVVPELEKSLSLARSFDDIEGEAAVLINSQGYLEIAAKQKSARLQLNLREGMKLIVEVSEGMPIS